MHLPKIQHWTWYSKFWKKHTTKLMRQRKCCTISCRKPLCINILTVDLCSLLRDHFTIFCNTSSFTSCLIEVCYIMCFDKAVHVKKWHNYLLKVEIYRKNIKVKKVKTSIVYFQLQIDCFFKEILWIIKVDVSHNFKTTTELRQETQPHTRYANKLSVSTP